MAPAALKSRGIAAPRSVAGTRPPAVSTITAAGWSCAWTDLHFALFPLTFSPRAERGPRLTASFLIDHPSLGAHAHRLVAGPVLECGEHVARRILAALQIFPITSAKVSFRPGGAGEGKRK